MRGIVTPLVCLRPRTLREALTALRDDPELVLLAGATDLYVALNFGTLKGTRFLDLWSLKPLRRISEKGDGLSIGALATYSAMIKSRVVRTRLPMLVAASREVGGVQIQNRGTLGGNIANASPAADTLPVLAAADATVVLSSLAGERRVPITRFYTGYRETVKRSDELITAVEFPPVESAQYFRKVGTRAAQAISKVVMAAVRGGSPRVALGSVGPTVIRLPRTEEALTHRMHIADAVRVLESEIQPIDDVRSTAEYRRRVAGNLLRECFGPTPDRVSSIVFAGERVALPTGVAPALVRVKNGRIVGVEPLGRRPAGAIDLGDAVLLPGLVDTHVHVNEPGRTEWEGFASATHAAAAGGVTTILDMPLNAIPATTNAKALALKRKAASGQCHVDVGFIGGVVADNEKHLDALRSAGVLAWKCFLVDSGVPEFTAVDEGLLRRVLPRLATWGLPLMVHAELPGPIAAARPAGVVRRYSEYAATRPVEAEVEAVELMIGLSAEYNARVHIVHVSSGEAAASISAARARGVRVTGETCPHYLTFAAEEIPDGAAAFKCAPPIRSAAQREALWRALDSGALDMVVSDHSPSPPALKAGTDLMQVWGGIASLQLGLSAVWTGARQRGISLDRVVEWMAARPADLVRLARKGRIAPGYDADLVVFDPDATWTVDASQLEHRHPVTPYHGLTLAGRVRTTYLRGE